MNIPKFVLAGPSERQQYLTHNYNDNTIRFVLNYPGILNQEALRKAVKAVVESVYILHASFYTDGTGAYWRVNDKVDDIHFFHSVKTAGEPEETAYSLSLLPVFAEDLSQIRVTLVQSDKASSLVVCLSHLCVDGGDGKYLLSKIIEGYNRILEIGSTEGLEIKKGSRAPEKLYTELTPKEMLALKGSPVGNVKSLYPYPTEETGYVQHVKRVIPAEVMNKARIRGKEFGATTNDLIVAALNQAYADLPEADRKCAVGVTSMMDLRKHCKNGESEGLCNMSGTMPTVLENGVPETYEETLKEIAEQTSRIKEDPYAGLRGMPLIHSATRNMPMWILLATAGKMYEKVSLGVTNLGNIHCADYAMGGLVPTGGLFGGPVKKKPGMQIAVMSFDGECVLTTCGQFTDKDAKQIKQTLDGMAGYIEAFADRAIK